MAKPAKKHDPLQKAQDLLQEAYSALREHQVAKDLCYRIEDFMAEQRKACIDAIVKRNKEVK